MPTFVKAGDDDWPLRQHPRHLLIGHADPDAEPPFVSGQYYGEEATIHWHVHCPFGNGEILSDKLPQWSPDRGIGFYDDSPYTAFRIELGHIEPGWCTMEPSPVFIYRWHVEGATIEAQWVGSGGCLVLYEVCQVGVLDLVDLDDAHVNLSMPGVYEVVLGTDGWGEDFTSWLTVLPGPVHPDDIPEDW